MVKCKTTNVLKDFKNNLIKITGAKAIGKDDSFLVDGKIINHYEEEDNLVVECLFSSRDVNINTYIKRFNVIGNCNGVEFVLATGSMIYDGYLPIGTSVIRYRIEFAIPKKELINYEVTNY